MRDKYFIDTNIFVYSFDKSNPQKNDISQNLISEALTKSEGIISYQVIQEFMNVALRKFKIPFKTNDCQKYLTVVLEPLCEASLHRHILSHSTTVPEQLLWRLLRQSAEHRLLWDFPGFLDLSL